MEKEKSNKIEINRPNILYAVLLTIVLFFLSFLYTTNDVSGNFVGTRRFGWPRQPIAISKVTQNPFEAEKVQYESTMGLLSEGWQVDFNGSAMFGEIFKITIYFIFYLAFSGLIVYGVEWIRSKK
jgi:hypothetical protein